MAAKTKKLAAVDNKKITDTTTTQQEREAWIARKAYYLAEARGFAPGEEMTDWLQAEQQFAARMELN
jgi:2-oxo-4-hydroxy-4-carboxy--5-ureidoimidazoline (OHCU) decarboxylase